MHNKIELNKNDVEDIYYSSEFNTHIRHKGRMILLLLILTFLFFFSLPFLNLYFPDLMKYKISGSFNVGLLLVILQYPLGAIVAWCYARKAKDYDNPAWLHKVIKRGNSK